MAIPGTLAAMIRPSVFPSPFGLRGFSALRALALLLFIALVAAGAYAWHDYRRFADAPLPVQRDDQTLVVAVDTSGIGDGGRRRWADPGAIRRRVSEMTGLPSAAISVHLRPRIPRLAAGKPDYAAIAGLAQPVAPDDGRDTPGGMRAAGQPGPADDPLRFGVVGQLRVGDTNIPQQPVGRLLHRQIETRRVGRRYGPPQIALAGKRQLLGQAEHLHRHVFPAQVDRVERRIDHTELEHGIFKGAGG